MIKKYFFTMAIILTSILFSTAVKAQTRTPWQMHDGLEVTSDNPLGLVEFSCDPNCHGDMCEYDVAVIPPADDSGWLEAPDGNTIGFSLYPSRVCQAPVSCLDYGDFTYFQTFVDIPLDVVVTEFSITFSGMDDGSRITIFNADYPDGLVVPGSYVYLGGTGTSNLAPYVVTGQNRVVITQVDDCCVHNNLQYAGVVLNGTAISTNASPEAVCQDIAVALDENGQAIITPLDVDGGSMDPDGDPITLSLSRDTFGCDDLGDNPVTLTVSDGSLEDTCEAVVTVIDDAAPDVAITSPSDGQEFRAGEGIDVKYTASDNCDTSLAITVTPSDPIEAPLTVGDLEITVSAADDSNNFSFSSITVKVIPVPATIDIDPDTLNLKSAGQWITAFIELPDGYKAGDIDGASVFLNGLVPACLGKEGWARAEANGSNITDHDGDGIPERMVKFERMAVQNMISPGDDVALTVTGKVAGADFAGIDTIRVIDEGKGTGLLKKLR